MSSEKDVSGKKILVSKVIVRNNDGEFLAVRESDQREKDTSGKWELPGGRIKFGENRFETAMRELREEVGLEVEEEDAEDVVRIEVESDHLVSCYIVYFPEYSGKPEINEESNHAEFRWFKPEEFQELDWHTDAGYNIVPVKHLEKYLDKNKIY